MRAIARAAAPARSTVAAQSRRRMTMPSPSRRPLSALAWLAAALAASALAGAIAFERARAGLRDEAAVQAGADAQALQSTLEKVETLPFVVSLHPLVADGLRAPDDRARIEALDRYLADVQRQARVAAVYVVEPSGLTIAASNWRSAQSFVGNNYRFRPYMSAALAGRTGRFYGIGATTGAPGYFLAQPVFAPDAGGTRRVAGVLVIKVDLEEVERSWRPPDDEAVALADAHGVLFLANVPAWRYRSLGPLDEAARREIDATQQYAGRDVARPLPPDPRWPPADRVEQPVGALGWRLVHFPPVAPARRVAVGAATIAALLTAVAGLAAFALAQRRRHARAAAAARQALVEASAQLEARIAERTGVLTRANADLAQRLADVHDAERLLRATQAELIQAGKLGMLGQMAAGVTHELNQPLTAMQVFADNASAFLERGDAAAARENLGHIADAAGRMGALVAQLKTFARKSDGAPGPVDLGRAIDNAALLLRRDFQHAGATLDIAIERPAVVTGDAIRVEQVLINLLRNALDAVRPCAERRVRVALQAGERAVLRISDTGPGISPLARAHLFEPFFTTKPSGAGLGLGLAISSSIVQAMGGTLAAGENPGGGAVFVLALPLQEEAATP
jgi:two-component system C4-dicarboxylate transport sensor histidine kinase DctB